MGLECPSRLLQSNLCGEIEVDALMSWRPCNLRYINPACGMRSLRDIWKSVKAKRDRDAEELRTKYTVSVKGSRDEKVALMRILSRKIWDSDKYVTWA